MKNLKIVLSTLFVAALGLAVSSFTVKNYNSKAFTTVCFTLNTGISITTANLQVPTTTAERRWHDADGNGTFDVTNWSSATSPISPSPCDDGDFACGICFDNANGLTLQEAVDYLIVLLKQNPQGITLAHGVTYSVPKSGQPNTTVTYYERSTAP